MEKFKGMSLLRDVRREVYEHEVFLSFDNDAGAIAFHEWWEEKGLELFTLALLETDYAYLLEK